MAFFKEELLKVKAFVFDVDGVLSLDISTLDQDGNPIRTTNIKDGFAIVNAIRSGYKIAIITGAFTESVRKRYLSLGMSHVFIGVRDKMPCLEEFLQSHGLNASEVLYMGDDIPDLQVMQNVGVPTCPEDAVPEVKAAAMYVSDRKGGQGCVRDVIEQVLRAQGKWEQVEVIHRVAK
ncbi:MAG: HAD hydrolase family protein [Bacteroidota bacterium]|nr:HAD hydrolase family protein [Bacteroidota bacterium]